MKKVVILSLAAIGFISVSCKKCHECHYENGTTEVEIGEYCDDDLTNIEASGFAVGDSIYEVHCEDH